MAGSIRIELDDAGIQAMLKSAEVMGELSRQGERLASIANGSAGVTGYETEPGTRGKVRGRVFVQTSDNESRLAEAEGKHLLRAVGGASGTELYTARNGKVSLRTAREIANYTRGRR